MKKLLFVCLSSMVVFGNAAIASPLSDVVHFPGGQVKPRVGTKPGTLVVEVSKYLPYGLPYDITCELTSDNKSGQEFDTITLTNYNVHGERYSVNGSSDYREKVKTTEKNIISGSLVFSGASGGFEIDNYDDTDTLTISNCMAKPVLS